MIPSDLVRPFLSFGLVCFVLGFAVGPLFVVACRLLVVQFVALRRWWVLWRAERWWCQFARRQAAREQARGLRIHGRGSVKRYGIYAGDVFWPTAQKPESEKCWFRGGAPR